MLQQNLSHLCGFDDAAQRLTQIYSRDELCPQALNAWFSSVDFEALIPQISCMAAAAGIRTHFAGVPEELVPRLRGITRYVHTLNSGMMAGACALGAKMNAAHIPVLLLDETALYMRYADAPQRHLWQMSIGVRQQDFQQALCIAREAGFTVEEYPFVAVARQDVTRQILISSVADTAYQWHNTTEIKKGSISFLCPTPAAIFLDVCKRTFRSLTKSNPRAFIACWMMDMQILLSALRQPDWLQIKQLADTEHVCAHIHLLLSLYCTETGTQTEYKELFGSEQQVVYLAQLLEQFRALPDTGCRIRRLVLSCSIRRPDSVWHTGRLCIAEAWLAIRNKLKQGN